MVASPMRPPDASISEQHVRLAQMLGQAKGRVSERIMYYRKPNKGAEAGWIVTAGTNPERQLSLYAKGFVPLDRYGFVNPQDMPVPEWVPEDQSHAYRVWAKILTAPGGPDEFPIEQIVQLRWYDPNRCPVPGTRFPQMAGTKIARYFCPECHNTYFHDTMGLGRHLRGQHEYDRTEIATYGAEVGINFAKELVGGRTAFDSVEYELPPEPESATAAPLIEFEDGGGLRRGPGRPRKDAL